MKLFVHIKTACTIACIIAVVISCVFINFNKFESAFVVPSIHALLQSSLVFGLLCLTVNVKSIRILLSAVVAFSVFIQFSYGSTLSVGAIMSVLSTSPSETASFLSFNIIPILVSVGLFGAMALLPIVFINKTIGLTFFAIGSTYVYAPVVLESFKSDDALQRQVYINSGHARGYAAWYSVFEYYMIDRAAWRMPSLNFFRAMTDTYYLLDMQTSTKSGWEEVVSHTESDLLIIGIGESLRAKNMSIYGYHRDTTPLLEGYKANLDIFTNSYAAGTNTYGSVPASLTVSDPQPNLSLSVVQLANDAGYKTYWLSNQAMYSSWDFSVSTIAEQSTYSYFPSNDDPGLSVDGVLIDKLKDTLEASKSVNKRLIILHFYGSHMTFSDRYPEQFERFSGSNKLVDSYDNSVFYTDYLNMKIIELANSYKGKYLFFADHGLGDPDRDMPLKHDLRQKVELNSLHVPFFATKPNNIELSTNSDVSLFYFECIFAQWAKIEAKQLKENAHCERALKKSGVTYIDSNLNIRTKDKTNFR